MMRVGFLLNLQFLNILLQCVALNTLFRYNMRNVYRHRVCKC
jgi:hypothetical protein